MGGRGGALEGRAVGGERQRGLREGGRRLGDRGGSVARVDRNTRWNASAKRDGQFSRHPRRNPTTMKISSTPGLLAGGRRAGGDSAMGTGKKERMSRAAALGEAAVAEAICTKVSDAGS
jgi:hypothetical protein